jgi:L-ascorbate metabolism protein UlaG (beta-lactamase superfamily)
MSFEEAALAVKLIQPTLAIPMHYGSIAGTVEEANEFVRLVEEEGFHAKVLKKI